MKRAVVLLLCLLMILPLAGCGEEAKKQKEQSDLYEKYEEIIELLEDKEYTAVMGLVSQMAVAGQNEQKDRPPVISVMSDAWYLVYSDREDAPASLAMTEDGKCNVEGKELLWLERHSDENGISGVVMDGGEYTYWFSFRVDANDLAMPTLTLWTCKVDGESVYSDKYIGEYRNHPQAAMTMKSWRKLDGDEGALDYLTLGTGSLWLNDYNYQWKITSAEDEMPVVIVAACEDSDNYTITVEERNGHYVLQMTNDATGETALYYCEEYGYETQWPEYRYPMVMKKLRSYLEYGSFYVEEMEKNLNENAARTYLHDQFESLGDYKDSAEYLARFSMIPSRLTEVIQRTTDQLNNVSDSNMERYKYDAQGYLTVGRGAQLVEDFGVFEDHNNFHFEYDANGVLVGITVGDSTVYAVCTPAYDDAGRLESMHVQKSDRQYTSTFTYDDQGRVVQLDIPYGSDSYYQYTYTYTYDDAGHLIQKTKTWYNGYYTQVFDYTYDGDVLVQRVESYQYRGREEYSTTLTYTPDAQGRPLSAVVSTTDSNATYSAREIVYQYEDLYFFDDSGLTVEEN